MTGIRQALVIKLHTLCFDRDGKYFVDYHGRLKDSSNSASAGDYISDRREEQEGI